MNIITRPRAAFDVARVVDAARVVVVATTVASSSSFMRPDARGVEASRALAASAYRSLIRAVSGTREGTTTTTHRAPSNASASSSSSSPPPISTRARGVLLDRARVLARAAASSGTAGTSSTEDAARVFTARCVVAATFFNRAHADPSGVEATHARAAVGYLDGDAKRRRRLDKSAARASSRREIRETRLRLEMRRALDDAFGVDRARVVGFDRGLFPDVDDDDDGGGPSSTVVKK